MDSNLRDRSFAFESRAVANTASFLVWLSRFAVEREFSSKKTTSSRVVSCSPPTNCVPAGMTTPLELRISLTLGWLAMKLNALEFTDPALPEHAPQSYAAKCGLLTLLDPCPTAYTTGAKSFTSPMLFSTL